MFYSCLWKYVHLTLVSCLTFAVFVNPIPYCTYLVSIFLIVIVMFIHSVWSTSNEYKQAYYWFSSSWVLRMHYKFIHTLRVHYAHAAANLNSGYSKYAKAARVHYFCTIALRTSREVLTRAWASRRVDLRERRGDSFSKTGNYILLVIFKWLLNLLN